MYFFGINWANEKHDTSVMDANCQVIKQSTIAQSLTGYQILERLVLKYGDKNFRLNIERSDGLLVD